MMMWKLQKDCWDIDCVLFHLASRRTKLDKREEKKYLRTLPYLTILIYLAYVLKEIILTN